MVGAAGVIQDSRAYNAVRALRASGRQHRHKTLPAVLLLLLFLFLDPPSSGLSQLVHVVRIRYLFGTYRFLCFQHCS